MCTCTHKEIHTLCRLCAQGEETEKARKGKKAGQVKIKFLEAQFRAQSHGKAVTERKAQTCDGATPHNFMSDTCLGNLKGQ